MTAEELKSMCSSSIKIKTSDNSKAVEILKSVYPDIEINEDEEDFYIMSTEFDTSELSKLLSENGAYVIEMQLTGKSPEDYFIERM